MGVRSTNDIWSGCMDSAVYHERRLVEKTDWTTVDDLATVVDELCRWSANVFGTRHTTLISNLYDLQSNHSY